MSLPALCTSLWMVLNGWVMKCVCTSESLISVGPLHARFPRLSYVFLLSGDGMDRERHKDRDFKNGSGKSSGGSKSVQTSPSKSSLWSASTPKKGLGHKRHLSGSTSAESGSGTGGKAAQLLGSSNLKSHHESTPSLVNAATATTAKVKYREQGVDELLQLKLHQALAATDEVPEGATIVLATGDGNVGQFNEDGFLGKLFCICLKISKPVFALLRSCSDGPTTWLEGRTIRMGGWAE